MQKPPKAAADDSGHTERQSFDLPSLLLAGAKHCLVAIRSTLLVAASFFARHPGAIPSPDVLATALIKIAEVVS